MSSKNTYRKTKLQGMYLWSPMGRHLLLCPPKEKTEETNGEENNRYHPLLKSYIGQNDDGDLAFIVRDPDGTRHVYPQADCEVQPSTSREVRLVSAHDHTGHSFLHCDVISETIYYNGWPKIKYKTGPRY